MYEIYNILDINPLSVIIAPFNQPLFLKNNNNIPFLVLWICLWPTAVSISQIAFALASVCVCVCVCVCFVCVCVMKLASQ